MRALKAGIIYFLLVFLVGWILGPIRELWAVSHLGRMATMLSEAVIMLIAMIVAARCVIRRVHVPRTLPATISMGLIAIGLLFPAEIAGVVWVRGLSLREYLASFLTGPGVVSLLMFLLFAAIPALVTLSTHDRVRARFHEPYDPRQRLLARHLDFRRRVQEGQTELLVSGLRRARDRVKQSGCTPLLVKIGNRR
jgi:hypothetical protein